MIGSSKPLASLSSGLLARKGQARPAMRPQGFVGVNPAPQEDLGWNDMGDDMVAAAPAPVTQLTPLAPAAPVAAAVPVTEPAPKPAVLRQREALDAQVSEPESRAQPEPAVQPEPEVDVQPEPVAAPAPKPARASAAIAARATPAAAKKGKAAFTLRLDAERHLRLRLASAVTRRSAQQLVTEALDQFLESLGEVEALARQVASTQHAD